MVDLKLLNGSFEYIEGTNTSLDMLKVPWREALVSGELKPVINNYLILRKFKNKLIIFKQEFDDDGKPFELEMASTSSIRDIKKVKYISKIGFLFKDALEIKTNNNTYYFFIN